MWAASHPGIPTDTLAFVTEQEAQSQQSNPREPGAEPWPAPFADHPVTARVVVPGSKSATNRALVLAALAGDLQRQSAAEALAGRPPRAEAVFLLLPGLREVSRRWFGGFNAMQFEGEPRSEAARAAAERVIAYYEWLDDQLAALWRREQGPRLLAVVSAYGVDPRGGWHRVWGQMAPGAALGGDFQTTAS